MSADAFHHIILTRFNCSNSRSANDREIAIRSKPGWLEGRFELFERYCLPSVLAQTSQDFEWRIYFDRHTPPEFLERARRGFGGAANIRLMLCDLYGSETVREDLARDFSGQNGWLVTTRFDNDDALRRDFVERLRKEVRPGTKEALSFTFGVIFGGGKTYLSRQESNAFISLSEPLANALTVIAAPHNEMSRFAPVREIGGAPAWMQVIHDSNVSNKTRGKRLPSGRLLEGFEAVKLKGNFAEQDNLLGITAENLTVGLARNVRDQLARVARYIRR